jgi:putative transposase
MSYWRLHYHLIFTAFERQPSLTLEREKIFYGVLYKKADELDLKIHAAGNTIDHVHVVVTIPPKLSVSECIKHLKGASAYAINHTEGSDGSFRWQEGYGALTVGDGALNKVMAYAAKQKEHHENGTIIEDYERIAQA